MAIIIYSTPTCHFCHQAKAYFSEHGIEYTDIDVSSDDQKAEEMVRRSGQMGVPVIDVNGTLIIGFDKIKIEQALASLK